ncbi:hypothetical protein MTBSS4_250048 [Magnetospirillum sp. SS-4]|nr:hypothetical protein MTBSS4_250048 [Magnetospirillum sp. SS-4]
MIRLSLPKEPYWLDLTHGVRVFVRPLTTAVYEAARSRGWRMRTITSGVPPHRPPDRSTPHSATHSTLNPHPTGHTENCWCAHAACVTRGMMTCGKLCSILRLCQVPKRRLRVDP